MFPLLDFIISNVDHIYAYLTHISRQTYLRRCEAIYGYGTNFDPLRASVRLNPDKFLPGGPDPLFCIFPPEFEGILEIHRHINSGDLCPQDMQRNSWRTAITPRMGLRLFVCGLWRCINHWVPWPVALFSMALRFHLLYMYVYIGQHYILKYS